ncbi:MAG: preprotein translocase subunit SecG [Planctomycetes bacterium]|nr:preprotein translocase subunit SecG [Planctomycetota bacterium]
MDTLIVVCSIVYVIASLFLCFVVLIQKGEGGGLGGAFGGGAVDTAFGAKADMTWKRATAVCAALFMILAIFLSVMQNYRMKRSVTASKNKNDPGLSVPDDEKGAGGEGSEGTGDGGGAGDTGGTGDAGGEK